MPGPDSHFARTDPGAPASLADFAPAARRLEKEAFTSAHGEAFLLHHGPVGGLKPATRPQSTVSFNGAFEPAATPAVPTQLDFLVFPVQHTGRSPFPNFISVGRTPNNDIVVNDVSISKFHAFFRRREDGRLALHDAGSSNGTFVDDQSVPPKELGEPVPLHNGARVRLGTVEMTFLEAEALQALVRRGL